MSEPSKTSGNMNSMAGAVKENVGSMMGNKEMETKGASQRAKGNAEHDAAKAKGYAEGSTTNMKGVVKDNLGGMVGNNTMEAEGKADRAKGSAQKKANE